MAKNLTNGLVLDLAMENLENFAPPREEVTNSGATLTTDQLNRDNQARDFNGSSDYIGISSIPNDNGTTGTIFIRAYVETSNQSILYSNMLTTGRQELMFSVNNGSTLSRYIVLQIYDGGSVYLLYEGSENFTLNEWHTFTVTQGGSTAKLYLDGKLIPGAYRYSSGNEGQWKSNISPTTTRVGSTQNSSYSQYYNGKVSNVKEYNRELDATEVLQLHNDTVVEYQGLFEDCVGYWDFNKDAKDIINQNDGTVTGATLTTDRFGIANHAYSFDGTDDEFRVQSIGETATNLTVAFWSQLTTPETMLVVRDSSISGSTTMIRWSSTSVYLRDQSDTSTSFSYTPTSDNDFHFFVIWYDGTTFKIYEDGVEKNSGTFSAATFNLDDISYGYDQYGGGRAYSEMKGGEIFLYKRALSLGELSNLYSLTKYNYIYPKMQKVKE